MGNSENLNVSNLQFNIMTRKRINELTNGEVTEEGIPTSIEGSRLEFRFPEGGLFSEKIFGQSPLTRSGKNKPINKYGFSDRNSRFGHINAMYTNPMLYSKLHNVLLRVLGITKDKSLRSIIKYESFLVYIPKQNNNLYYFQKEYGNNIVNFLCPIPGMNGLFLEMNINNLKNAKDSKLRGDYRKMREDSSIIITTGVYAIILLLSRMNFKAELKRTYENIEALKTKSRGIEGLKSVEKDVLKALSRRYTILVNFVENEIEPIDLINDKLLVIPAGWRDINILRDTNGVIKTNKPAINKTYADILSRANNINKTYSIDLDLERIFKYKKDLTWLEDIPMTDYTFIGLNAGLQNIIYKLFTAEIKNTIGVKQGKIRQSVLRKRLDFTGRAVITPDPNLELDELGVPIYIILEFYKNRIKRLKDSKDSFNKIISNYMSNTNVSRRLLKEDDSNLLNIVSDVSNRTSDEINLIKELNKIISNHRILSIRFPSLHRYSLLGFRMKIVFDNTIHLHPLVCAPYNADFDGDNMSLYLVETKDAVEEVDEKLLPTKNLLNSNGQPLILPSQDAILGTYYLTLGGESVKNFEKSNLNKKYKCLDDMERDLILGRISMHDEVTIKSPRYDNSEYNRNYHDWYLQHKYLDREDYHVGCNYMEIQPAKSDDDIIQLGKVTTLPDYSVHPEEYITSTVGRFILNKYIPQDLGYVDRKSDPYSLEIDEVLIQRGKDGVDSKMLKEIIKKVIDNKEISEVKFVLDSIKKLGYHLATKSGMSISIGDLYTHPDKTKLVNEAQEKVHEIEDMEKEHTITREVARERKIAIWSKVNDEMTEKTINYLPPDNPIKMMSISGSRGNTTQIAQLMSMRGLMSNTSGDTIETPVLSSFLDGLTILEYFTSSYGVRKGMFDRSNRTKETGRLTRTAVYGNSEMVVTIGDCGDSKGYKMFPLYEDKLVPKDEEDFKLNGEKYKQKVSLGDRVYGKITLEDIFDENGNKVLNFGELIERKFIDTINKNYKFKGIQVRTPMTCKAERGVCAKCYGKHLGANRFSRIGDSVGIIASQTIGEPGTQLTMRTFHTGGVAKGDVTKGFENMSNILEFSGQSKLIASDMDKLNESITDEEVNNVRLETKENILNYLDIQNEVRESYPFKFEDFGVLGGEEYVKMQNEIKEELQTIYEDNGISLSDIHYEISSRSMGNEFKIIDSGDSVLGVGDKIKWKDLLKENIGLVTKGAEPIVVIPDFKSLNDIASSSNNPMLSVLYQNITRSLCRSISDNGREDAFNPLTSVAVSNRFISPETMDRFNHIAVDTNYNSILTRDEFIEKYEFDKAIKKKSTEEQPREKIEEKQDKHSVLEWNEEKDNNIDSIVEDFNKLNSEKSSTNEINKFSWGTVEKDNDLNNEKQIDLETELNRILDNNVDVSNSVEVGDEEAQEIELENYDFDSIYENLDTESENPEDIENNSDWDDDENNIFGWS